MRFKVEKEKKRNWKSTQTFVPFAAAAVNNFSRLINQQTEDYKQYPVAENLLGELL